jgi:methionine-rich copper-binding protein CopC
MRLLAVIVTCVLSGAVLLGGAAEAHANYVRSNPASDARLVKPPTEVRIEFSEPPDPKGSDIQVLDTTGKRHDKGDVGPSGDPNGLRVSLEPIPDAFLIDPDRLPWLGAALVDVDFTGHLHDEHVPSVRAWLVAQPKQP